MPAYNIWEWEIIVKSAWQGVLSIVTRLTKNPDKPGGEQTCTYKCKLVQDNAPNPTDVKRAFFVFI